MTNMRTKCRKRHVFNVLKGIQMGLKVNDALASTQKQHFINSFTSLFRIETKSLENIQKFNIQDNDKG